MKLKTSAGLLVATLALSSIVWTICYLFLPGPALSPAETLVVVGICLGIVSLGGGLAPGCGGSGGIMRSRASQAGHPGLAVILTGLLTLLCAGGPAAAKAPVVACSADRLAVSAGEVVVLRAWAEGAAGRASRYEWEAPAGHLEGRGQEVRWNLAGLRPGTFAAAVRVADGSQVSECIVRVIVTQGPPVPRGLTPPAPPPARETGRSLLVAGQSEAPGYGLYSYLLLGSPPTEDARERCLRAVEAYWGLIPEIASLEQYVKRKELNIAYLPVRALPGQPLSSADLQARYDYARARSLLRYVPGTNREGPYILSLLRPVGDGAGADALRPHLFQDLSKVPPALVASWVREFLNQAAQERLWEVRSAESFALRFRATVAVLGMALPEVKKALDTWIAWVP
jgi:hypothetical protein